MNIICENCKSKFRIADEKIPAGKSTSFPCPKCRETITVSKKIEDKSIQTSVYDGFNSYESDENTFYFAEEGNTALLCEEEPIIKKKISKALDSMKYHITEAADARDALMRLRYHAYDLIIVNESFAISNSEANAILTFFERSPMVSRRNTCIVLISNRFRTMDNMMALQKSVNSIINMKDITDIDKILNKITLENTFFFKMFNETLKEAGRI